MSKSLPAAERLRNAALHYLGRYESSVQSLRRVLTRHVQRWAAAGEIAAPDPGLVERVIAALVAENAVNDTRYAATKARALFRAARSGRATLAYLAARGVDPEIAAAAIEGRFESVVPADAADLDAALRFAGKRRLGRFRDPGQRAEKRDRDLAALGRAGFSYAVARQVVDDDS